MYFNNIFPVFSSILKMSFLHKMLFVDINFWTVALMSCNMLSVVVSYYFISSCPWITSLQMKIFTNHQPSKYSRFYIFKIFILTFTLNTAYIHTFCYGWCNYINTYKTKYTDAKHDDTWCTILIFSYFDCFIEMFCQTLFGKIFFTWPFRLSNG